MGIHVSCHEIKVSQFHKYSLHLKLDCSQSHHRTKGSLGSYSETDPVRVVPLFM